MPQWLKMRHQREYGNGIPHITCEMKTNRTRSKHNQEEVNAEVRNGNVCHVIYDTVTQLQNSKPLLVRRRQKKIWRNFIAIHMTK